MPTVVVAGKNNYWKKTAEYGSKGAGENGPECEDGVCHVGPTFGEADMIEEEDIQDAINEKLEEYNLVFTN